MSLPSGETSGGTSAGSQTAPSWQQDHDGYPITDQTEDSVIAGESPDSLEPFMEEHIAHSTQKRGVIIGLLVSSLALFISVLLLSGTKRLLAALVLAGILMFLLILRVLTSVQNRRTNPDTGSELPPSEPTADHHQPPHSGSGPPIRPYHRLRAPQRSVARGTIVVIVLMVALTTALMLPSSFMRTTALVLLALIGTLAVFIQLTPKKYPLPEVVPQRFIRGRIYWPAVGKHLYARLGWKWLAKLSWHERDYNSRTGIWENSWVQKTLGCFSTKGGGGKTTCATWFAVIWAFFAKRHIVAMDVNHSPGGTANLLGIDRNQTVQLREFLAMAVEALNKGALMTYEKFATLVRWHHEADVSVIASESRSNKPLWDHLMIGLTTAKSVAHGLVCDVGNSIAFVGDLATFYKVDTPIFVANLRTGVSLKDMADTMQEYARLGFPDKVSKSIVVIFGGKLRHRKRYAKRYERFGITLEQVFVVPFNRYMQNSNTDPDADDTKIVSRKKVPLKVRVTKQEALLAALLAEPGSDQVSEEVLRRIATSQGPVDIHTNLEPANADSN
jgi:hypothetical protein